LKNLRWFRLEGSSFTILSPEDRDGVLGEFTSLIASLKQGVVLARRVRSRFSYMGYEADVNLAEFYVGVRDATQVPYFSARPVESVPRPRKLGLLNPYTLRLEEGSYARVLVAYRFPAYLPEGFLYSVFGDVSEIALVFRVVERSRAVPMVERVRKRKLTASESVESREQAVVLEELARSVLSGADLTEVYLLLTITGEGLEKLNNVEKHVRTLLKGFGVEVEAPPTQKELYDFRVCNTFVCVEKTYVDTQSLKPLFFLIDEELHDEGGVFIGVSGTGSPVLLNPWSKPNLNFVVVGVTGSGKSMTAKVFLKRLRELYPSIPYVGVDPESEYVKVSEYFASTPVEVGEGGELGLDPVKLLQLGYLDVAQASDILSEVYVIPENLQGLLRRELSLKGDRVDDIEEFAASVRDPALSRYLQGVVAEPDIHVFRGEPPRLHGSVIFGLKNVRSRRLKILISSLISTYAFNTLLTKTEKSVFFVDEAWLFMETPTIISLFENIARRGRKYGVLFMYVSQRAEDLVRSSAGRTILEQSATALILRQEPEGRDAVKQACRLSDAEADLLVSAPPGTGVLKAWRKRITLHITPTEEELRLFSTSVT